MYVEFIREIAKKHNMENFKLAYFYSEVDKEYIRKKMLAGETIEIVHVSGTSTAATRWSCI